MTLLSATNLSPNLKAETTLLTTSPGGGGGKVNNANGEITAEISVGHSTSGVISQSSDSRLTLKSNLVGQFYDLQGLSLAILPDSVEEDSTSQLNAKVLLDDDTLIDLDETGVTWSALNGPIGSIEPDGEIQISKVASTSTASVQGSWNSFSEQLFFVVQNTDPDNFGSYAGDGVDDDWQLAFFGADNPEAAPHQDTDRDGQDNFTEFIFGFSPIDPLDAFSISIALPTPNIATVTLNRVIPGRTYVLLGGSDLSNLLPIGEPLIIRGPLSREEVELVDPNADSDAKFYQIQVTK